MFPGRTDRVFLLRTYEVPIAALRVSGTSWPKLRAPLRCSGETWSIWVAEPIAMQCMLSKVFENGNCPGTPM